MYLLQIFEKKKIFCGDFEIKDNEDSFFSRFLGHFAI